MKRIFALVFVFILAVCFLTACGDDPLVEAAEGFSIDNEKFTLYRKVGTETEVIDMSNIAVTEDYEWRLFNDEACQSRLTESKVALAEGDNVFYLVIFDGDDEVARYTVTVRRNVGLKIEEGNGSITGTIDIGELFD